MHLVRFENAADFYAQAGPFLLEREAEHNLLLGLCTTLIKYPEQYQHAPYLALVKEGENVVGAAMRTPPFNLILAHTDSPETVLPLIAHDACAVYGTLHGVLGKSALSKAFAEQWQALTGQPYRYGMAQCIYQLERVNPVTGVPGALRQANAGDLDLMRRWVHAFQQDAFGHVDEDQVERAVQLHSTSSDVRGLYFWEDGEPVSMAAYTGPTPNGIRVGLVYTPPEQRRKGYASACVAALSQVLLDGGRKFCFLFTDLSNPTSNHIYQDIGYRPVVQIDLYEFDEARATEGQ